jgi:AraC-like DNA-binding protein
MQPTTPEQMRREWVGRYVHGDGYAHLCASPELWGVLIWGRPSEDTALALGKTLVLELEQKVSRHASIFDCSRMEGAEPSAFRRLSWYVAKFGTSLEKQVSALAIVRPDGLEGALVAGVPEVLAMPYPAQVFDTTVAALAWLESLGIRLMPDASGVRDTLEAVFRAASGMGSLVASVRELLDDRLHGIALADAARALGVSERTLQRKLGEASTSFQHELADARVRAAQRMLLQTDAPLTNIALEVGCASLQHFSALFRKRTGESPSAWRRKHRQ